MTLDEIAKHAQESFEKKIVAQEDMEHLQNKDVVRFVTFGIMRYQGIINNCYVFVGRGVRQHNDQIIELWFERGTLHYSKEGWLSNEKGYSKIVYTHEDHPDEFRHCNESLREVDL